MFKKYIELFREWKIESSAQLNKSHDKIKFLLSLTVRRQNSTTAEKIPASLL